MRKREERDPVFDLGDRQREDGRKEEKIETSASRPARPSSRSRAGRRSAVARTTSSNVSATVVGLTPPASRRKRRRRCDTGDSPEQQLSRRATAASSSVGRRLCHPSAVLYGLSYAKPAYGEHAPACTRSRSFPRVECRARHADRRHGGLRVRRAGTGDSAAPGQAAGTSSRWFPAVFGFVLHRLTMFTAWFQHRRAAVSTGVGVGRRASPRGIVSGVVSEVFRPGPTQFPTQPREKVIKKFISTREPFCPVGFRGIPP